MENVSNDAAAGEYHSKPEIIEKIAVSIISDQNSLKLKKFGHNLAMLLNGVQSE